MANTDKNKVLDLAGLNRYDELLKQMITTHTSNKDNPHEVTKEQIGLSSVENKSVSEILAAMTADDITTALGYIPQRQGAGGGGSYGFASESEAGVIMSGGDISVSEDGIVSVTGMNGLNVGSDVRPIYFKDGKPVEGYYTLAEAASKSITNITEATNLGWLNTSVGGLFVPSLNTLAFWNGEYAEGMSNIEYFKLGKFGSMATRSEDEYLETGDIADWAKAESKPEYTYTEVGADKAGAADTALASAKEYALNTVNTKIAELINSAPETMDTLGELAMLMTSNQEAVDILNEAIAKKATTSDLTTHTGNTSNPHGVTKAQVGLDKVDNTADADKSVKHAATADALTVIEANTDVFRNVWFAEASNPNKSVYNAAFQYNPATDTLKVGNITGKASSASTADALAVATAVGSATNPVYIDATGKPVKTTYTLGVSVPADAKFTDTTYSDATTSAAGLMSSADKTKLDNIAKTYLPLAGGTMNTNATIIFPNGAGMSSSILSSSTLRFTAASGNGWARGISYYSNDGNIGLGTIGAFGTGDSLDYFYIGNNWDTAKVKIYNSGDVSMTKLMATSAVIDEKVTLAYSDITDSLSFNFA